MKKVCVWSMALIVMMVLVAQPVGAQQKKVGISVMFSAPFFDAITQGVKDAMEPEGYEVVDIAGEFNVEKQIRDTEDFVIQDMAAIFIEPFDSKAIRPALEAAKKAGIPVICLDAPAFDVDLVVANVATDNYDAGVQNAEHTIEQLGGKGNIVILDSPQAKSSLDRANGFVDTVNAKAPEIKIVAQQDYAGSQDKALPIMENILQGQKDIQAVFTCNENGAFATIAALETANRLEGTLIYSVDGSAPAVEMIKAGKLTATSAQQPYQIGLTGGQTMLKYLNGESIEDKEVKVPVIYVTSENAEEYVPF
ncbi:MAG: sugar ABC transporter substrate-binding protein [bacterium]|nr:sugar ABC transporter substrate-binding protein [bacterium]